jgi:hypothetical protein
MVLFLSALALVESSCGRATVSTKQEIGRTVVSSSAMRSIGYDAVQEILEIEFPNGAVYQYFNVPAQVAHGLLTAASHGLYFHEHIRQRGYRYERIE